MASDTVFSYINLAGWIGDLVDLFQRLTRSAIRARGVDRSNFAGALLDNT